MSDKLFKFDRVHNLFKNLTDKKEIREKLDEALQKSYEEINCPCFREYEFAYAYAHLLDDHDKAYDLLGAINNVYGKYFDYKLMNAYAIKAIFDESEETQETAFQQLLEAEQVALEDNQDNSLIYFGRWKSFIIAWKELFDNNTGMSRCIHHSIERWRKLKNIQDILAISKAYNYLYDMSRDMWYDTNKAHLLYGKENYMDLATYYMDLACIEARTTEDIFHIARAYLDVFEEYNKCELWLSFLSNMDNDRIISEVQYDDKNHPVMNLHYYKACNAILKQEKNASTFFERIKCVELWDNIKNYRREHFLMDKIKSNISHPCIILKIINFYKHADNIIYDYSSELELLREYLKNAGENIIPDEHLYFLWMDYAMEWKTLNKITAHGDHISKSNNEKLGVVNTGNENHIPDDNANAIKSGGYHHG